MLTHMRPDDAADLLTELDQERRLPILQLLPTATQAKLRALLGFNPGTAGGLMTPDFLALPPPTTTARPRSEVRTASGSPPGAAVRPGRGRRLSSWAASRSRYSSSAGGDAWHDRRADPVRVATNTDLTEVAVRMTDFNLVTCRSSTPTIASSG